MPHETRSVIASAMRPAFVRFGVAPDSCWWRGRVVDTRGEIVPGYTVVRFDDLQGGEQRRVYSTNDGVFAVRLPAGAWRGQIDPTPTVSADLQATLAADARLDGRDHEADLQFGGSHVLCRLVPANATTLLPMAELGLALERDGTRVVNRPPFAWNGATYMIWHGLAAGVYRLHSVGQPHCVGEPDFGYLLDLSDGAPRRELEVVFRWP